MAETAIWAEVAKTSLTILGTLAAVALGSRLNASNAREQERERLAMAPVTHGREKIWEHRREAYSAIIGKMHLFVREADDICDSFHSGEIDPQAFWHSPGYDDARKKVTNAFKATRDLFDEARLTLSSEFEARYIQMRTEIYDSDEDADPPSQVIDNLKSAQTAYDDLLAIAKREIAPATPLVEVKKAPRSFRGLLWWRKAKV